MQGALQRVGDRLCVAAGVFVRNGTILLGRRRYTANEWKDETVWTFPGGRCEAGETVEQALRREICEEVGIRTFTIEAFIADAPAPQGSDAQHLYMFHCTTEEDVTLMEPEKFSEWRWVPLDEYMSDSQYLGFNEPAREMIVAYLRASTVTSAASI